jgi:hypothetical protein
VVVLDVTGAPLGDRRDPLDALERLRPLELGHDRLHWPAQVVCEDIEAPAMRHPEHDLPGAATAGERH